MGIRGIRVTNVLPLAAAILLLAGGAASAAESGWVLVDDNPQVSAFYFDQASVSKPAAGLVSVTTKAIYSEQGKADALEVMGHPKGFDDLSYTNFVYTIDCPGEKSRLEDVTHYDSKGEPLREFKLSGKTDWEAIAPDTRLGLLADVLCK